MEKITYTNTAAAIHLSSLLQYCIPFGNFIFPIVIWATSKDKSEFLDEQGKEVINFQISLLIYSVVLALIAVPILIFTVISTVGFHGNHNSEFILENLNFGELSGAIIFAGIAILLIVVMKLAEFFLIIYGALKASQGTHFRYPFTINFFK
jgi:uncharacterized Tic20 family protein